MNDPEQRPRSDQTLLAAGIVYTAMTLAALGWLAWRDRLLAVGNAAVGEHGVLVAGGAGLVCGLAGAAVLAVAARRFAGIRVCERRVAEFVGPLPDGGMVLLATGTALAEELFFRLAVQDVFGPVVAVATYTALNTGPGFWPWLPVALVAATTFTTLVQCGLGLLSATIAHALINYLALRRMLPT